MAGAPMRIDRKDAGILALVQGNNRLTAEQIGEVIGLSHHVAVVHWTVSPT